MLKVIMLISGFILAFSTSAYGQEKFSVSGEFNFHEEKGQIYVWLITQEEFEKQVVPTLPARSLMIKPNPQQLKDKKVNFKFIDVPKGIYGIICHHDLNNNGKLDYGDSSVGSTPPIEPYGYSGPSFYGPPWWDDIKFNVDKDVSGIELKY